MRFRTSLRTEQAMIELKNVERSYKAGHTETWVLRRIGLTIREGEFVTVMGPSGAGKSSLLNVLALLDDGWSGEYWCSKAITCSTT
jgi:putative ABC transport system ATP-binding protein